MPIQRIPVDSSMLSAIGYDADNRTLYAEFSNTGKIFGYVGVPPEVFQQLLNSSSIGGYMRSLIIDCYPDFWAKPHRRDGNIW